MYFQFKNCKVKSISNLKSTLLHAILISTTLLFVSSCTETNKPEDTKKVAEDHNVAKFSNTATEHDAQFLVNAAEINLEEIKLGAMVENSAMTPEVKKLGEMMEDAHTKMMKDLTALSKKKLITLPDSVTNNSLSDYKSLSAKKGMAFDKAYCDMTVTGHKAALKAYETASTECVDVDIKAYALATVPDLRMHLDKAITCQKNCEKMK